MRQPTRRLKTYQLVLHCFDYARRSRVVLAHSYEHAYRILAREMAVDEYCFQRETRDA